MVIRRKRDGKKILMTLSERGFGSQKKLVKSCLYSSKTVIKSIVSSEDFLVGIFYLPKQIQLEFVITRTASLYHLVSIHGIWITSMLGKEKKKKDNFMFLIDFHSLFSQEYPKAIFFLILPLLLT